MKPEKKQEYKEKLLRDLDKNLQEAEERKNTIETNYLKSKESVDNEVELLKLQKEATEKL